MKNFDQPLRRKIKPEKLEILTETAYCGKNSQITKINFKYDFINNTIFDDFRNRKIND